MTSEETREALEIEQADAWFEYLDTLRSHGQAGEYDDVEPWAWARLNQRLQAVESERARQRPAAA